jgi:hypothetical protein
VARKKLSLSTLAGMPADVRAAFMAVQSWANSLVGGDGAEGSSVIVRGASSSAAPPGSPPGHRHTGGADEPRLGHDGLVNLELDVHPQHPLTVGSDRAVFRATTPIDGEAFVRASGEWRPGRAAHTGVGVVTVPTITYASPNITVAADGAYRAHSLDDYDSTLVPVAPVEQVIEIATEDVTHYLYADASTGLFAVTTDHNEIEHSQRALVARIIRTGTTFHTVLAGTLSAGLPERTNLMLEHVLGYRLHEGLGVAVSVSSRHLSIDPGKVWHGATSHDLSLVETTTTAYLAVRWDGAAWTVTPTNTLNNTQYNNAAGVQSLTGNGVAVNWIWRGVEDQKHVYVLLGDDNYNEDEALGSGPPVPPSWVTDHAILLGRVLFDRNSNTVLHLQTVEDLNYSFSGAVRHNDTTDKQGGTTGEYYHLTQLAYDEANLRSIKATGVPTDAAGNYVTTLTYNATTRTWTVLPIGPATTFDIFIQGVKHTFSSIVATHTTAVGGHFLYIDLDGSVVVATSPWSIIHDAMLSFVYFDGTRGNCFEERHHAGRDIYWHANQHALEGTKAGSGFSLTGYTEQTATDAGNSWAIASGRVSDEDINVDTVAIADGGPYTAMHRVTDGSWVFDTALNLPFLYAGATPVIQYNMFNSGAGTWGLADVPEDSFVNYWVFGLSTLPAASQTGWPASPTQIVIVPGQATYTTESLAHAESVGNLSWGTMPFQEIAPLYQITIRKNASSPQGYSNTGRCAIYRVARIVGSMALITSAATTDHGSLAGLSDDDHSALYPRWYGSTRPNFFTSALPADPENPGPTDLVDGDLLAWDSNQSGGTFKSTHQTIFPLTVGATRVRFSADAVSATPDTPGAGEIGNEYEFFYDAANNYWEARGTRKRATFSRQASGPTDGLWVTDGTGGKTAGDLVFTGGLEFAGSGKVTGGIDKLTTATGAVSVAASAAPAATDGGGILVATSSTVAAWTALGAKVRDTVLTGYSATAGAVIAATDTVLQAFNKAESSANKGAANGYAPLDSGSKVPAAYLPAYVDDVLEYANLAALPVTGTAGIIYVTLDTNKTYRWSGSAYVEISPSPGSTDSVTEGATNLYFTAQRVRDTLLTGLSLVTSAVISATDTVLSALGKLQAQVTAHFSQTSGAHGISAYGATLIDDASASDARTTLGLGGAAVLNVGATAGTVAAGDHTHSGLGAIYEPVTINGELMTFGPSQAVLMVPYVQSTYDVWASWSIDHPGADGIYLSSLAMVAAVPAPFGSDYSGLAKSRFSLSSGKYVFEIDAFIGSDFGVYSHIFAGVVSASGVRYAARISDLSAKRPGGAGVTVIGSAAAESLSGGAGDDSISGQDGADTITGAQGNDTLTGNADNDDFVYYRGDGHDTLVEAAATGTDRLVVHGIDPADAILFDSPAHGLVFVDKISGGSVRGLANVEQIVFDDTTVWDSTEFAAAEALLFDATAGSAVVMVAVDLTAGKMWFQVGDSWVSGDPAAGTSPSLTWTGGTEMFIAAELAPQHPDTARARLTATLQEMTQAPPAGFGEWKTTVTV